MVKSDSSDVRRKPVLVDTYVFSIEKKQIQSLYLKVCGIYTQLVKETESGVYVSHIFINL